MSITSTYNFAKEMDRCVYCRSKGNPLRALLHIKEEKAFYDMEEDILQKERERKKMSREHICKKERVILTLILLDIHIQRFPV